MTSKITKHDLRVLSIMTDYLFCDSFKEILSYSSGLLEDDIDASNFHDRRVQARLKSILWEDFLNVKKKLKELAK